MTIRYRRSGFLPLLACAFLATAASAQQYTVPSAGWLAWQGCWQAEGAPSGEVLCVLPDGAGVRLLSVVDGSVRAESRVVADGRARPVEQEGCGGTELAHWSADGRRVFLTSDLTCGGSTRRQVSGVMAITAPDGWISVQAVTIEGTTATRTVRYRAAEPANLPASVRSALRGDALARAAARSAGLAAVTEQDVDEALRAIDPAAVEEWLMATGQPYDLADDLDDGFADVSVHGSAVEQMGGNYGVVLSRPRAVVHVIERPTYVTHVVRTRTCWDPFSWPVIAGYVLGTSHHVGWGVSVGTGYDTRGCGPRYRAYYSPWGYDLYGWRVIGRPVHLGPRVIVIDRRGDRSRHLGGWSDRSRGGWQDRSRGGWQDRSRDWQYRPRDRDDNPYVRVRGSARQRGDDGRSGDRYSGRGRATPEGYSSGNAVRRTTRPEAQTRHPEPRNDSRPSGPTRTAKPRKRPGS